MANFRSEFSTPCFMLIWRRISTLTDLPSPIHFCGIRSSPMLLKGSRELSAPCANLGISKVVPIFLDCWLQLWTCENNRGWGVGLWNCRFIHSLQVVSWWEVDRFFFSNHSSHVEYSVLCLPGWVFLYSSLMHYTFFHSDNKGMLSYTQRELTDMVKKAVDKGMRPCKVVIKVEEHTWWRRNSFMSRDLLSGFRMEIHAIGDACAEQVINSFTGG